MARLHEEVRTVEKGIVVAAVKAPAVEEDDDVQWTIVGHFRAVNVHVETILGATDW